MPQVLVIMGSKSDLPVAEKATALFKKFGITYEAAVASAHRTATIATTGSPCVWYV